jgi:hypothetical protein
LQSISWIHFVVDNLNGIGHAEAYCYTSNFSFAEDLNPRILLPKNHYEIDKTVIMLIDDFSQLPLVKDN